MLLNQIELLRDHCFMLGLSLLLDPSLNHLGTMLPNPFRIIVLDRLVWWPIHWITILNAEAKGFLIRGGIYEINVGWAIDASMWTLIYPSWMKKGWNYSSTCSGETKIVAILTIGTIIVLTTWASSVTSYWLWCSFMWWFLLCFYNLVSIVECKKLLTSKIDGTILDLRNNKPFPLYSREIIVVLFHKTQNY